LGADYSIPGFPDFLQQLIGSIVLTSGRSVVCVDENVGLDEELISCSSLRERGAVQFRSKPARSRVSARRLDRSYALRSRTICSSRVASSALTEVPSSAARMRTSRSSSASSLSVMLFFIGARTYVLHYLTCKVRFAQAAPQEACCSRRRQVFLRSQLFVAEIHSFRTELFVLFAFYSLHSIPHWWTFQ
jgi:hypothetical protein